MSIVHGKKTDIEDVRACAFSLDGSLLSEDYKNMLSTLSWRCQLGHVFETTFNHVKNRGQWCPICGREKGQKFAKERMQDPAVREKISSGHLKRLKKQNFWCGQSHRKVASSLRDNLTGLFRNLSKHKRILKFIGCSFEELKSHLELQFQQGMTWENRGLYGWHIDHVVPLVRFSLQDEASIKRAFHYSNLRPMWAKDNLKKGIKDE